jgi:hypothetical protein
VSAIHAGGAEFRARHTKTRHLALAWRLLKVLVTIRLPTSLVLSALLFLLTPTTASADALRKVDRATRSSSSGGSSGSSSGSARSWSDSDDDDDDLGLLLLYLTVRALGSPWTLPRNWDRPDLTGYAPYPFALGPGFLRAPEPLDPYAPEPRKVALQLDAESGYLLEGVVPASFAARLLLPHRFELGARVSVLGDVLETPTKYGTIGTAHAIWRHAQMKRADLRTGIGMRMFVFDSARFGFDFLYAIDGYIRRRGILRIELHAGSLGNAFAGEARATVGVMVHRTELYAGYDHTAFFGQSASATLGGPIAGFRTWF